MRPPSPNRKKEVRLKRGPWTAEEDKLLTAYIQKHGYGSRGSLPHKAGLEQCGKSCRLRWINYLRPDIKRGKFSLEEEQTIIQLHAFLGNRWSAIAAHLPKRTDNEIKNHWNTHLKKRLIKMGIDPMTHKPSTTPSPKNGSNLSHMAQWESARLQAEARLVRESKQVVPNLTTRPTRRSQLTRSSPRCLDVLKAWQGVVAGMFVFSTQDPRSLTTSTLRFPSAGWGEAEEWRGQGMKGSSDADDAWFEEDSVILHSLPIENIMEGLSDAFILNSWMGVDKSTDENTVKENGNCWDSVLNLLSSTPCGSPVLG
ncbi:hypothetical protein ES288_A12G189700v1 [Gossypium darwinii]|uniref:Uncharacterized protein n=1 Tax=Gossypium darwinii TaxID=34276 RepID=A0A5D2EAJ6_GOSDA|nr:hypothetical protein ES288_A12G189700v1 [Gossypium darwinii]